VLKADNIIPKMVNNVPNFLFQFAQDRSPQLNLLEHEQYIAPVTPVGYLLGECRKLIVVLILYNEPFICPSDHALAPLYLAGS
jgi:hypothetical protein